MKTLCKTHFLQMIYRKTDGATLWSQNERNLDCALTFQTHSILQRFLVRFDSLQLDCNDHLYIYDGAHATGTPKVNNQMIFSYVSMLLHLLSLNNCLNVLISRWTYLVAIQSNQPET